VLVAACALTLTLTLTQVVRELHAAGHHIIIHTARRMRTHGGNVPAVVADVGHVTIESLRKFNIPYHEVHAASRGRVV
jgi:hypothetical protein